MSNIAAERIGGLFRRRQPEPVSWPEIPPDTRDRLRNANPHLFGVLGTSTVLVPGQPAPIENPTS